MKVIFSFTLLMGIRTFSQVFYKLELNWISEIKDDFSDVRLAMLLNHTSLYEPLFLQAAPVSFIWQLSKKMVAPGADKTLNRPIVGFFWKLMGPDFISISRKRDKTWFHFLKLIKQKSIVLIAPEGRMKRSNGLDSKGKPMSVRSGVAEIIDVIDEGRIAIAYSGGLHHVQHPGQHFPKLFQTIKLNIEVLEIHDYKALFNSDGIQFRKDIVADLETRVRTKVPA